MISEVEELKSITALRKEDYLKSKSEYDRGVYFGMLTSLKVITGDYVRI